MNPQDYTIVQFKELLKVRNLSITRSDLTWKYVCKNTIPKYRKSAEAMLSISAPNLFCDTGSRQREKFIHTGKIQSRIVNSSSDAKGTRDQADVM